MADLHLQLRLSADGSGLVGTLRTATGEVQKFRTESEKANEVSGASADKIGRSVKAYDLLVDTVGQAIGAFGQLIKSEVDYADQVGTTAQRLGVTTEMLSGLGALAKRNSSDMSAVTSGLESIGEAAIRAGLAGTAGAKQYSAAFAALNVDVRDAAGNIKPAQVLMEEVAVSLDKLPDGALRARLATQLFGSSGKELTGTLDELAKTGLQGVIDKAHETGEVITAEGAARAKLFKDGMQELSTTMSVFAGNVGQAVLPTLLALAGMFTENAGGARKMGDESSVLRSTVEGLGSGVVVATETFRVLFTMLFGGIDVLIGITDAAARAVTGIGYAAAAAQAFQMGQLQAASTWAEQAKAQFGAGWDAIASSASRAWMNITSAGADADAKIAEYNNRISAGYKGVAAASAEAEGALSQTAAAGLVATEQAAAAAEAQRRYEEALRNGGKAERERAKSALEYQGAIAEVAKALSEQRGELSPLDEAIETYKQRVTEAHIQVAEWAKAGVRGAEVQAYLRGEIDLASVALEKKTSGLARQRDVTGRYLKDLTDEAKLIGMTTAQQRAEAVVTRALAEAKELSAAAGAELVSVDADRIRQQVLLNAEMEQSASSVEDILSRVNEKTSFEKITDEIDKLAEALAKATDPKRIDELQSALDRLSAKRFGAQLESSATNVADGLRSLQSMAEEGSTAYQAMQLAIDAANVAAAIGAIMNQGMGDPYTAFARMAAMAAAVATMVDGIGSFAGRGFTDTAAQRQASQGTGSVLGDPEAKSESIADAIEITADATSELVGINRGMLRALIALQDGLAGASGMLARGAADADFSGMNLAVGGMAGPISNVLDFVLPGLGTSMSFDPIFKALFGGKSKITDQGIVIFGGALNDLLDDIAVGAYQEVQSRSWAFGSRHTNTGITDVSDEFGQQFQLVMQSIADTVREGALALGLLPADIEAAMAAYRVEEIKISLKDLDAEEQAAELAAVFGEIFDGLAGDVVPFIEQFQQVGEGLGETLVRVATGVQVTQEAIEQLGLSVTEKLDPEAFAQMSEALIAAMGGIEEFIGGMSTFVSNFAPEAHQFQIASDALASAFSQVGLTVPATAAGMWDLMQSLEVTTEAGREQIATLLRLSDVANSYYDFLDQQVSEATELLDSLGLAAAPMSAFTREVRGIRQSGADAAEAANVIARAQGRQGASAMQLARITQWTADQIAAAVRRLQEETRDILAELQGGVPGSLDAINARIAEFEQSSGTIAGGIDDIAAAGENLFESWRRGVESVQDYLDSMLLGDLSALTPEQQLAEARRQFEAMQAAALGGDVDALASLPQMADVFLRLLRGSEASGDDYNAGFEWVRDLLQEVMAAPGPGGNLGGAPGAPVQVGPSPELIALYEARDALLAAQEGEHRRVLAEQLAQNLRDMATLLNVPILEMVALQGTSLRELTTHLGVDLTNLTTSSVEALGNLAATLGITLTTLTGELGIELTDLGDGLRELTTRVGIDLSNLTTESTRTLGALATTLGADLSELAIALGADLGNLADAQSLLNQALAAEINSLPSEQSALLAPLLGAITAATNEADANAAIAALEEAVNVLAPDIRTQLAPYLEGVFPADALSDLDYLSDIQEIAAQQLDVLDAIRDNLAEANRAAGVPSYAVGTGFVMGDQLANIHHGEAVVPAAVNAWFRGAGWSMGGGNGSSESIVAELRALRAEVTQLRLEKAVQSRDERETIERAAGETASRGERAIGELAANLRGGRSFANG